MKIAPIVPNFKSAQLAPHDDKSQKEKRQDFIYRGSLISAGLIGISIAHLETRYEQILKITNDLKVCPQYPIIDERIKKNEALLKDLKLKRPLIHIIISIAVGFFMAGISEWAIKETAKRKKQAQEADTQMLINSFSL